MAFQLKQTETVYRGRAFNVRRDWVILPDGREISLDVVEHVPSVTVAPLDEEGNLLFVRQYRHPAQQETLELPAGVVEAGESPLVCAHREIREEVGMAATHLQEIGEFFLAAGYSTEYMHVYLATGLHADPLQSDVDEFLSVVKLPVEQAYAMARQNQFRDAKTLATLFLVQSYLKVL